MADISVIIPCHNAADTLQDAFASLIAAAADGTAELREIVLVDDGSTDATRGVIDRLARSDRRVVPVVLPANAGVSCARNAGLDRAAGTFVFFMDADDKVLPGALDRLVAFATDEVDFVRGTHLLWDPTTCTCRPNEGEERNISEALAMPPRALPQIMAVYSSWNALFRRSLIEDGHLRFAPGLRLGEDRHFNYRYLVRCRAVTFLNDRSYLWRKPSEGTDQATQRLVQEPEPVFEGLARNADLLHDPWLDDHPRHRRLQASALVVELVNFLTRFSRSIEDDTLSLAAKTHLDHAFSALDPGWADLTLPNLKGRVAAFDALYALTATAVGQPPDAAFFREFLRALGAARTALAQAESAELEATAGDTARAREVLQAAYGFARATLDSDYRQLERETLLYSGAFDPAYYARTYPDVAGATIDPLEHFLVYGAGELRDPNPWFRTAEYLARHPGLLRTGINPLVHFVRDGSHTISRGH